MSVVFFGNAGKVVASAVETLVGVPLAVDGLDGSLFESLRAVIIGFDLVNAVRVQFTPTFPTLNPFSGALLAGDNYVYAFGDRQTPLRLDGLGFASDCNLGGSASGVDGILAYYRTNRASNRASPVFIQVGRGAGGGYVGYLVGCNVIANDPETGIVKFSLLFEVFPN